SVGIEQDDVDPGPPMERRRDGAAGVPGRGDEDRDLPPMRAMHALERGGREARAEILERARRAMKQLEDAGAAARTLERPDRRGKVERVPADRTELSRERVIFREGCEQAFGNRRQRRAARK